MSKPTPRPVMLRRAPRRAEARPLPTEVLPKDRLEWIEAWGMASRSMAHVWRPSTKDALAKVFDAARNAGRTVAFKGAGRSYGDAFQNTEGIVLDLSRMNRILDWNPETGIVTVEPGVRLCDLWRYIIEDGYWPPVVSGTMFTTIGGCASMNIHGKNAYSAGPFGSFIKEFEFLTPDGALRSVTRESDPDLFHGAISGFGMLGCFTKITLKMKRIHSGNLEVQPKRVRDFDEMIASFEDHAATMDYMVGWADCFPSRRGKIGRGEMHFARHLDAGEDPMPAQTLRVENQELPDTLMGWFPKSIMHRLMKPLINDVGMRLVNAAKYAALSLPGAEKPYLQSHAAFAFLLDYVPNWKNAYRPGGLIQYQSFVPRPHAARVFREQVRLSHRHGIIPYLAVTKKHIPDPFLISHGVDGYSLALDYRVTESNRRTLWKLCHNMDELVLEAGGRLYFAKDSTMPAGTAERYLPPENMRRFESLRSRCDPEGILSTNLHRRIFPASQWGQSASASHGARVTA